MKYKSGFTLLEILLYLVIGGITLAIASFSFVQISRLGAAFRVNNELTQASEMIIAQIEDAVQDAQSIISPNLGSSANSIRLNINGVEHTIAEVSNNLTIISGVNTLTLNPESVRIENTSFEVINNENNTQETSEQMFKFTFTIRYIQPTLTSFEYNESKDIETIIRLPRTKSAFSPILNTYPIGSNGAAYSLRKLSGTIINSSAFGIGQYSGPAIRVRRDRGLDQSELDIGFNNNGILDTVALQNFVGYQNFLTQSENIISGSWELKDLTSINNTAISPNGDTNAETLNLSAGNTFRYINQNTNVLNGITYTDSYYVKANNGYNFVQLTPSTGFAIGAYQNYNLSNGTLAGSSGISPGQATIESIGNSWYRISLSATANANTSGRMLLAIVNSGTSSRLESINIATPTNSIFVWGGQRHLGNTLKPYQPTLADANTGDGYITRWYDQSGNNNHLSQSTLLAQPRIVNGVNGIISQNGAFAIQFNVINDGTNDELNSTSSATFHYGFLIGSRVNANQSYIHRNGSLNYRSFAFGNAGDIFDIYDTYYLNRNTVDTITTDPQNALNSYTGIASTPQSGTFSIGRGTAPEFGYLNGTISELLIYATDQSANRESIRLDLNSYYNIP